MWLSMIKEFPVNQLKGATEEVALGSVAANVPKDSHLLYGFNALGYNLELKPLGKMLHGSNNNLGAGTAPQLADQ